jgi:ParB family chromosome partitioning protein
VQPIIVRPIDARAPGGAQRYEIIAGERRWRAAQQAGVADIPAIVRRVPDKAAIAMALIENIQRENLNPLEEARALERLIAEFGLTHQQAAEAVGRSRGSATCCACWTLRTRSRAARRAPARDGTRARCWDS